jgi:hypothetical protein
MHWAQTNHGILANAPKTAQDVMKIARAIHPFTVANDAA